MKPLLRSQPGAPTPSRDSHGAVRNVQLTSDYNGAVRTVQLTSNYNGAVRNLRPNEATTTERFKHVPPPELGQSVRADIYGYCW